MAKKIYEHQRTTDDEATSEQLAVGFVASEGNSEPLARAILRAKAHDYDVFVTNAGRERGEAVAFAAELGARVVELRTDDPDPNAIRQRLAIAAENNDCSGVLVNLDVTERVDYERADETLDHGEFCVAAPTGRDRPDAGSDLETLVAIPAYDEATTIASVVEESLPVADRVLVVDDGSDDETATRAAAAGATVVEHDRNRGYGAALQTAFREADARDADHLVVLDADGQHDPTDVTRLVETQRERGAEVVIGSRFAGDGQTDAPLYRRFGLAVVNVMTNLSLGAVRPSSRVRDTQSGFRAYDRTAVESLAASNDIGDRMSASTDILVHAHVNDYDLEEVGTTITYDVEDASSHNPVQHGLTLVKNILYTIERQRPITALGVPGFASALIGIGFAYVTVANFLNTGSFPLGLALVSSVCVLIGVFASFTGIILHALNTQVVHRLEAAEH